MSTDLRQHLGRLGEQLAAEHLERLGYTIVARNHRTRFGEIDLDRLRRRRRWSSCEVKTRRGRGAAVGRAARRASARRSAAWPRAYLAEATDRPRAAELRFDAIGVVIDARGRLVAPRPPRGRVLSAELQRELLVGQSTGTTCRCSGETPWRWIASRCSGVE